MRIILVVLTLLGALACGVLLRMSVPSEAGESFSQSVCAPSARINCDYVLASRWAKIGPLPSAAVGLVYFLALSAWFCVVGIPNEAGRRWKRVPLLVATAGLAGSIYFTYAMAVHLPVWCTWCLGVHGINLVMFLACAAVRPTSGGEIAYPSRARAWGVIGGAAGGAALLASLVFGYQMQITARRFQLDHLKATNNAEYIIWRHLQNPVRMIPARADDFAIGKADAPHTVVVFSDFECASCSGFHRYAARLTNQFPDAVRIVFRHYPLCRTCNPVVPATLHYFACEAARAAEAARKVGSWQTTYQYHQLLFDYAARLDAQPYEAIAAAVKLDVDKWRSALDDPATAKRITEDAELAGSLGVEGTPGIFLDGRRLEAWHLLTTDPSPVVDLAGTDALWGKLLVHPR